MLTCLAVSDRLALEERYQGRVQATLEFAFTIDDFDNLVDPCHLYECCLGPEPSTFVLKKVTREKKSRFNLPFFLISSFFIRAQLSNLLFCRNGYQVQQRYARSCEEFEEQAFFPCLLLDRKITSWMRVKMKPLPLRLSLVPHLLLRLPLR